MNVRGEGGKQEKLQNCWKYSSKVQNICSLSLGPKQSGAPDWSLSQSFCLKALLYTITPPPAAWTANTRHERSIISGCLCEILNVAAKSELIRQHFSKLLLSSVGLLYCCSPSASAFFGKKSKYILFVEVLAVCNYNCLWSLLFGHHKTLYCNKNPESVHLSVLNLGCQTHFTLSSIYSPLLF